MALTPGSYSQGAAAGDAETGWGDTPATSKSGGPFFQDVVVSRFTLGDGTLRLRLSPKAFPQRNANQTGTDSDGITVPPPAKTVYVFNHG